MSRHRTSLKRFVLAGALVTLLAGVVVAAVPAASFNDSTPCPADGALLVCPSGAVDAPYSLQLMGQGGCDLYRWEIVNGALPAGLSMSSSGFISGTPMGAGRSQFWIVINDVTKDEGGHDWCNHTNQSEREFAMVIAPGLVVTTESAPAGVPGAPYSLTLTAAMKTGPDQTAPLTGPVTWSVVEGQLPPGLALGAGNGVISGTPSEQGAYGFTVRASLANGTSATRAFAIDVTAAPLTLVAPQSVSRTEVGLPVRVELGVTGGTPPYAWTIAAGGLPAGVALAADGTILGRPSEAGVFRFTAAVSDGAGQVATYSGLLNVAPRLAIASLSLRPGTVGRLYRARIAATGGIAPRAWRVLRGPLPRGVRLDPTTGVLTGTLRKAGRYRVRLQVVDALGVKSAKTYLIRVAPAPKRR